MMASSSRLSSQSPTIYEVDMSKDRRPEPGDLVRLTWPPVTTLTNPGLEAVMVGIVVEMNVTWPEGSSSARVLWQDGSVHDIIWIHDLEVINS